MATNDFKDIKTFKQLQEARNSLEYQVENQKGKLWVPFALAAIRTIRSWFAEE
ncbi:MAG: hypothetical protein NC115_03105 [Bacteroidales bacterium]|nr:hypothetical protein [Bacteroides sp.]MCM1198059.1 hypothetical protein [Clostridium sp.]MCM1501643.1 hypothetical protein [Bacteroidales bacterium]